MRKSIAANKTRKRHAGGRPATGHDPAIAVRLPKERVVAIDRWAKENDVSRSEAIRVLIDKGLEKPR
jgi:hypothetical protein